MMMNIVKNNDDNKYRKGVSKAATWKKHPITIGLILLLLLLLLLIGLCQLTTSSSQPQQVVLSSTSTTGGSGGGMRILYCMTTLTEYDSGKRATKKGYDRLQETVIPVLKEGVESMIHDNMGYQVDVVLICGYEMTREHLVRQALPDSVGLQIWNTATPLGYKLEDKTASRNITTEVTRGLARQHRFVIKDKLPYYDFFVNFEDDMLIKGETIENFLQVTLELYRLRAAAAPDSTSKEQRLSDTFYGAMSKKQLQRMIPGFIRVEALLDEEHYGTQEELDPVPLTDRPQLDPSSCCHLESAMGDTRPAKPDSDKLFLWETSIKALGIRKLPLAAQAMDWVLMQRGPRVKTPDLNIGDYWSGRDHYFGNDFLRPDNKAFAYINNQGGWMATRQQIWEWHTELCPGGFLPPFDPGEFNLDGLDMRNVEYWSGGMHLVTKEHGCNLQRIIPLNETMFARSLLYHTANNKQRQLHGRRRAFVKINDLYGQLNTVLQNAKGEMNRRIEAMNAALHQG